MLGTAQSIATVGVKSLKAARAFYEDLLGLTPDADQEPGTTVYKTGGGALLLYESAYAGSNKATAVTWDLGDKLAVEAAALKARGVVFEHYDMPGLHLAGDLHVSERMKVAWFKDPDGNIHALVGR